MVLYTSVVLTLTKYSLLVLLWDWEDLGTPRRKQDLIDGLKSTIMYTVAEAEIMKTVARHWQVPLRKENKPCPIAWAFSKFLRLAKSCPLFWEKYDSPPCNTCSNHILLVVVSYISDHSCLRENRSQFMASLVFTTKSFNIRMVQSCYSTIAIKWQMYSSRQW